MLLFFFQKLDHSTKQKTANLFKQQSSNNLKTASIFILICTHNKNKYIQTEFGPSVDITKTNKFYLSS